MCKADGFFSAIAPFCRLQRRAGTSSQTSIAFEAKLCCDACIVCIHAVGEFFPEKGFAHMPNLKRLRHLTVKSGFTLLELLFLIAVVGILAAILLPALSKAHKRGRRTACSSNLRQIGLPIHLHSVQHEGELPWSGGGNNARCFASLNPSESFLCYINQQEPTRLWNEVNLIT